ncbi:hypothetical protein [Brevundimonas subvibrioides]|uniref:Uncharacterized protein n=1 Tax=Brevundimonas subvibrioides (strain ATCC 15264 / DSM 4735 / LMG 14903 / NBRC 16000 / CB 81) TaxID=633149 RepID=D9QF57_BRESC|nr:hypothetical protein [Brevundimonas subvibrioides]ADL00542.1 hypothetical protein Bresu_1230 [Brevundimonas subvibrioides ATCC 15264]
MADLFTDAPADRAIVQKAFGAFQGETGKRYGIVAGVIKNAGSGWELIINATHTEMNVDSVSSLSGEIVINYATLGAVKVISFVAGPDEVLAQAGLTVGATVTPTAATLRMARADQTIADYISYSGSAFTSLLNKFTIGTFTSGNLTLTHANTGNVVGSVTSRSDVLDAGFSSAGSSIAPAQTILSFFDRATGVKQTTASTEMKAALTRTLPGGIITAPEISDSNYPGSNIWFVGVFELA